ncbi:MAG: NAD(+)/NADH kinase [Coriobacteriia bacterium]|nr:NAD(+)/NADH kinase [Coriobacteriia bacterium]
MRVLLVSNATKVHAREAMQSAVEWLALEGIDSDCIFSERLVISDPMLAQWSGLVSQYDLVVSFGGDGTILRVTRMIGDSGIPLLAFNFGGRGFLASAQPENLIDALKSAVSSAASYEERALIEVEIDYSDQSIEVYKALNEVVVSRLDAGRIVSLEISINSQYIDSVRSDGLLVATATGSTAYALSVGGPLVRPSYDGMIVVPISAHTLKSWSIVTGSADVINIQPSTENTQQLVVFLDGEIRGPKPLDAGLEPVGEEPASQTGSESAGVLSITPTSEEPGQGVLVSEGLAVITSVTVRSSASRLKLVHYGHDFYEQIVSAFFGGPDGQ